MDNLLCLDHGMVLSVFGRLTQDVPHVDLLDIPRMFYLLHSVLIIVKLLVVVVIRLSSYGTHWVNANTLSVLMPKVTVNGYHVFVSLHHNLFHLLYPVDGIVLSRFGH